MIPFDRRVLDRAVHSFDLAMGPGMVRFCQAMLNPIGFADHVKSHLAERHAVPVPRLLGELDTVICQDRVNLMGPCLEQVLQELPGCFAIVIAVFRLTVSLFLL